MTCTPFSAFERQFLKAASWRNASARRASSTGRGGGTEKEDDDTNETDDDPDEAGEDTDEEGDASDAEDGRLAVDGNSRAGGVDADEDDGEAERPAGGVDSVASSLISLVGLRRSVPACGFERASSD